jgi:hypothetical protein
MIKIARFVLAGIFMLSCAALAVEPLAGTDLRLESQTTAPANLSGRAGLYNKLGAFTWHTAANVDLPVLQCSACSSPALAYVAADGTIATSSFYFNSGAKQVCDASAIGSYCLRLNSVGGVATIGYDIGALDGNYVQSDTTGTKVFHNGANFAQSVGSGASEEWEVNGKIHSQTGGYVFPDSTVQTTAATNAATSANITPSFVTAATTGALIPQGTGSNNSTGLTWLVTAMNKTATGVRFSWAAAATTVTVKLWSCTVAQFGSVPSGCVQLASATGAATTNNDQIISFSSGVALTAFTVYATTVYDTSGTNITQTTGGSARQAQLIGGGSVFNAGNCLPAGPAFEWCRSDLFGAGGGGGGAPLNGGGGGYYAEPVFQ